MIPKEVNENLDAGIKLFRQLMDLRELTASNASASAFVTLIIIIILAWYFRKPLAPKLTPIISVKTWKNKPTSNTLSLLVSIVIFVSLLFIFYRPFPPKLNVESVIIGRKAYFDWQSKLNSSSTSDTFELQGANDCQFNQARYRYTIRNWNFHLPVHINGSSCWRIRRKTEDSVLAPWSDAVSIVQFESVALRIRESCQLLVGIPNSYNRSFFDYGEPGKKKGLEISIIEEIANKMHYTNCPNARLKISLKRMDWSKILPAVQSGKVDIGIGGITIFPEREKAYNVKFSEPYFESTLAFVTLLPVDSNMEFLNFLKSHKIGVQNGSSHHLALNKLVEEGITSEETFVVYSQLEQAMDKLLKGFIKAVATDSSFAVGHAAYHDLNLNNIYIVPRSEWPKSLANVSIQPQPEMYGVAVGFRETDILRTINETITALKVSGSLKRWESEHYKNFLYIHSE